MKVPNYNAPPVAEKYVERHATVEFDSEEFPEGAAWEIAGRYHIDLYVEKTGERRSGDQDVIVSDFVVLTASPLREELPPHLDKIIHTIR